MLYVAGGKYLLLLFMEKGSVDALAAGMQFLWILSPFYFAVSAKLVADGVLRGISAMWQFMAATFTDLILRVLLAFVWCAWPAGWITAMALSVSFYRKGWKKRAGQLSSAEDAGLNTM